MLSKTMPHRIMMQTMTMQTATLLPIRTTGATANHGDVNVADDANNCDDSNNFDHYRNTDDALYYLQSER